MLNDKETALYNALCDYLNNAQEPFLHSKQLKISIDAVIEYRKSRIVWSFDNGVCVGENNTYLARITVNSHMLFHVRVWDKKTPNIISHDVFPSCLAARQWAEKLVEVRK